MSPAAETVSRYLNAYSAFSRDAVGPAWMGALRKKAIDRAAELGIPTTKDEEWKYTNIAPVAKLAVNLPLKRPGMITLARLAERTFLGDGPRIVFVNGLYAPELSSLADAGITIAPLMQAMRTNAALVERHLGRVAPFDVNSLTALNTAFVRDGAVVVIPAGVIVEQPIQVFFVSQSPDGGTYACPRLLVVAERGSRATLIETHMALSPDTYFSNGVAEIVIGEDASFEHYCMQSESTNAFHVAATAVAQERGSSYRSCVVTTGGRITRNALHVTLAGEEASCELDGLYIVAGARHVDNHTAIDHTRPHCTSVQVYKGILSGQSRAVFNGKVFVRQDAQKTDARQTNKNLILSDDARVDTKPQLEIFADDVKCTHGATVGQIDETALFYLKSRGIGAEQGRRLLTYGFAHEVIERISIDPLRTRLETILLEQVEHAGA